MTEVLVIVPSRGRPENALRLLDASKDANVDFVFCLDDDDPSLMDYVANIHDAELRTGPRESIVAILNRTWGAYSHPVVGFMGDDHVPRTPGWDQHILDQFSDGALMVYGNDLHQGANIPTAVFMSRRIPQALGYMAPPSLCHLFVDDAWKQWGLASGRLRYLPEVIIEHMHPDAGKAARDESYSRTNHPAMYSRDREAFEGYMREQFPRDAERLRGLR